TALTEAAALFSSHIHDLPQQIEKTQDDAKAAGKIQHKLLEEIATLEAERMLARSRGSPKKIYAVFTDRDAIFIKLLAQKLTASEPNVVALLASLAAQPTLVFAQSPAQKLNMGQLLKETLVQVGGRGGGSANMAQGGFFEGTMDSQQLTQLLQEVSSRI